MQFLLRREFGVDCKLPFFDGALRDARDAARANAKYVLIYLHCGTHARTEEFVGKVLCSDALLHTLGEHCVVYGASVHTREGYLMSIQFGATTFPFVALEIKGKVIMDMQGVLSLSDVCMHLGRAFDNGAPIVAQEITYVQDRVDREQLRNAQQREFEHAQQKDLEAQKDAQERREREHREKEAAAAKEAAVKRLEAEAQAAEERKQNELLERKALALSRLGPEPEPSSNGSGNVARIKLVVLGAGHPVERNFSFTDPVSCLYDYATSQEGYDGRPFYLVTGFPPKRVDRDDARRCIGEMKELVPRSVVHMREEL